MVPLPSVVYNGRSQIAEPFYDKPISKRSYEFCGVDDQGKNRTYHGTYRCIRVVATDWEQLAALDQKVSAESTAHTKTAA